MNEDPVARGAKRKDDPGGGSMALRDRPDMEDDDEDDDEEDDGFADDQDDDAEGRAKRRKVGKFDPSAMRCGGCSTLNSADSNYCRACGKPLQ